jgi:hypothetical protein
VADVTHPDDESLTSAIQELLISASAWSRSDDAGKSALGVGGNAPTERTKSEAAEEAVNVTLTPNQARVLRAMAKFDSSLAVSNETIASETGDGEARIPALSARTVGPIVQYLIQCDLAWRPMGGRSGAALNMNGRRQASKIAD